MYIVSLWTIVNSNVNIISATLILNWNEDGKIYKERLQEKQDAPPPMNLNPWIRGFRLAFVLLFVGFDVGMIIYNKVSHSISVLFTHITSPSPQNDLDDSKLSKNSYNPIL